MNFPFSRKWILPIALCCFAACQQDASGGRSPEEVVRQYQAYLDKNEFDKAKSISTPEGKEVLEGLKVFFSGPAGDSTVVHTDFLSITCEETGNTALCNCKLQDEYETYESAYKLQKIKGRWLVDTNDEGVIIEQSESEEIIEETDTSAQQAPHQGNFLNMAGNKKIGLFFGSFNPVHIGHLIIANYMATQTDLDQVWLVVSPQNPLKPKSTLARDHDRLHLVRLAIDDNPMLRASDVEFNLPKPSYTIDTLTHLREQHPDRQFVLIMGGDNLATLHKWKNYELILRDYEVYVYQRPSYDLGELASHESVKTFEAPLMQISASYIRKCIEAGKSVQYLVPPEVYEYLLSSSLYK